MQNAIQSCATTKFTMRNSLLMLHLCLAVCVWCVRESARVPRNLFPSLCANAQAAHTCHPHGADTHIISTVYSGKRKVCAEECLFPPVPYLCSLSQKYFAFELRQGTFKNGDHRGKVRNSYMCLFQEFSIFHLLMYQ